MISIFTPTYNRAYKLPELYLSLCNQTDKDFEWIVVDDGSEDDTASLVCDWQKDSPFPIIYQYQPNGGKHRAINRGLSIAKGELFFIVDSDDYIIPNAVEIIMSDWGRVKEAGLCGISYLRGYDENSVIGDVFPKNDYVDNFIEVRFNQNIGGDKAEIWVTDYLKEFPFPEFDGEKFLGESWLWIRVSRQRDMLWRNKIIYITEYLEGGLSKSGRKLRIQCPLGGIEMSLSAMDNMFSLKQRMKMTCLYLTYSFFAHKSLTQIISRGSKLLNLILLPTGYLLYIYWSNKYL